VHFFHARPRETSHFSSRLYLWRLFVTTTSGEGSNLQGYRPPFFGLERKPRLLRPWITFSVGSSKSFDPHLSVNAVPGVDMSASRPSELEEPPVVLSFAAGSVSSLR